MKGFGGLSRFHPMANPRLFRFIVNAWPPYLGAAIRVTEIASDWKTIRVAMKLHWYNRNYVKSHFGGSLFAMTDPFYMLMLLRNLGGDYVVWDMAAHIHFLRPGRGMVSAVFYLDGERLTEIRAKAESGEKVTEIFYVEVVDESGEKVAAVKKTLYVRKKQREVPHREAAPVTPPPVSPAILSSSWGRIEIEGLGSGRDWRLWPGGGGEWNWQVHDTGHWTGVAKEDVEELVERGATTVVLTTGRLGRLRVSRVLVDEYRQRGVRVIVVTTRRGISIYNELQRDGVAVGGLFHSTC
jgi:acyl-coenzyme A thioesterase PaaI-like protein